MTPKNSLNAALAAACLLMFAPGTLAASAPTGLWKSIDDQTGEVKSLVRIVESRGVLSGRIEQVLRKGVRPDAVCRKCTDDRRMQPILGLEIIRGASRAADGASWEDGEILQPETGRTFALRLTPIEGGRKLEVRASKFGIGRTQIWVRAGE
jgi:uncharacterized protein (DUF2147 family)